VHVNKRKRLSVREKCLNVGERVNKYEWVCERETVSVWLFE
jgi:hypothetical protein